LGSREKLKMEEPSLGLIRTEILLILESMLSSLIKFMSSNINAVLHQKYVYHPKSTPTLNYTITLQEAETKETIEQIRQ